MAFHDGLPYARPYYRDFYQGSNYGQWDRPPVSMPANNTSENHGAFYQTPYELFAKPKQPANWYQGEYTQQYPPYPPQQNHAVNGLLTYFQDNNGQVDLDKMFSTIGQMANSVQQISPVVKQISTMIKGIK